MSINASTVLIHAGFTKERALLLNLLTATSAIVGVVLSLLIGQAIGEVSDEEECLERKE